MARESTFGVVIAAAGKSTRFGNPDQRKPFVDLCGRPVWQRSVEPFVARPDVTSVVMVVSKEDVSWFKPHVRKQMPGVDVVVGGSTRSESVGCGLAAVGSVDFIAVHDAARPLVTPELVDDVFAAACRTGAAILATPVASTVKRATGTDRTVKETVPRDQLWLAQTPQVGRRDWFEAAYADPSSAVWQPTSPTDESELLERCGHEVTLVESPTWNFKVTTQADLAFAEAVLQSRLAH